MASWPSWRRSRRSADVTARLEIERRPLGASGVEAPRIMLGCGNFGGVGSAPAFFGRGQTEDEAFAIMDAAWELGITHFDTPHAHGGGGGEGAIGRGSAARGGGPPNKAQNQKPP